MKRFFLREEGWYDRLLHWVVDRRGKLNGLGVSDLTSMGC